MGRDNRVTLRDYIERGLTDLARYHDRDTATLQAEIDRRLSEVQREIESRFRETGAAAAAARSGLDRRIDALADRVDTIRDALAGKTSEGRTGDLQSRLEKAEAALERQRGRLAAYAAIASFLTVAVAVITLVVNHVRL